MHPSKAKLQKKRECVYKFNLKKVEAIEEREKKIAELRHQIFEEERKTIAITDSNLYLCNENHKWYLSKLARNNQEEKVHLKIAELGEENYYLKRTLGRYKEEISTSEKVILDLQWYNILLKTIAAIMLIIILLLA